MHGIEFLHCNQLNQYNMPKKTLTRLDTKQLYLKDIVSYSVIKQIMLAGTVMIAYMVGQLKLIIMYLLRRKLKKMNSNVGGKSMLHPCIYIETATYIFHIGARVVARKQYTQVFAINEMVNDNYLCKIYSN